MTAASPLSACVEPAASSAATSSAFLIPLFGVTWGGLFLGEPFTLGMLPGVVLVLVACALVTGFHPGRLRGPR